jgi:FkbM family methyltransferase
MFSSYDGLVYKSNDEVFTWHINNGLCEPYPRELKIVKSYLEQYTNSNNTFIDVGGHIGTQSIPYSRLFKTVVAFEPNIESYNYFIENIRLNNINNITVHNKGVYNKHTHCKIVQCSSANSGCICIKECMNTDPSAIECIKLDDLHLSHVDFLKIDTEGCEFQVLEGATELIQKYKPLIQVETNDSSQSNFGYSKDKIYEFLKQNDYKALDDDGNNPIFYCS